MTTRDLERFWALTKAMPSGCVEWQGANDGRGGYGKFHVDGRSVRAIRWIYDVYNAPRLTSRHVVGHTCDNPRCVAPTHLVRMTHRQNMRDKAAKGRVVVRAPFLTQVQVARVKDLSALDFTPRVIADLTDIKYTTVRAIVEGRRHASSH